jgi:hypothetical protein
MSNGLDSRLAYRAPGHVYRGPLLLLGLPIAYWLATSTWRFRFLLEAVVALPLVLPPTVLGFYLLLALGPKVPLGGTTPCSPATSYRSRFRGSSLPQSCLVSRLRCSPLPQLCRCGSGTRQGLLDARRVSPSDLLPRHLPLSTDRHPDRDGLKLCPYHWGVWGGAAGRREYRGGHPQGSPRSPNTVS